MRKIGLEVRTEPAKAQDTARPRDKGIATAQTQGTLGNPSNVINFPKKKAQNA